MNSSRVFFPVFSTAFWTVTLLTFSFAANLMTIPVAFAAPASTSSTRLSPREEALRENSTINEKTYRKTIHASEAQQANVESFLKLEDPTLELRDRPWLWTFAFKVQSLQPIGVGTVAGTKFDLQNYGQAIMPSVELGVLVDIIERPNVSWSSGLAAHAGASTQTTELAGSNGYVYRDARLNTTVVSGIWSNRFKTDRFRHWSLLLNPEMGAINYTQNSTSSDLANFSQQNSFWGMGVGLEYAFNKKWGLVAEYKNRTAGTADIAKADIQSASYEIGTSVIW